jgi:hypothetical protein
MKTVILNFGYAESAAISSVIMSTYFCGGVDFEDPQIGMQKLAMDFYDWHKSRLKPEYKNNPEAYDFCYDLLNFSFSDTNSCDWDEGMSRDTAWSPFWSEYAIDDLKSGNFIWIPNQAEHVIAQLILQQKPEAFLNADQLPQYFTNVSFTKADLGVCKYIDR